MFKSSKTNLPVVLTGATGLIGGHLLEELAQTRQVHSIGRRRVAVASTHQYVIDDFSKDITSLRSELPKGATFVHCAAVINGSDEEYWQGNVEMTRRLLDLAVACNAGHFVFFSTGGVYGYQPGKLLDEEASLQPIGVYGHTKRIAEDLVLMYAQEKKLPVTILRLYFPFSMEQKSGIFELVRQKLSSGEVLTLNKHGAPRIQPIHCDDVVRAVSILCEKPPASSQVFNLCGDEEVSFAGIVDAYASALGVTPKLKDSGAVVGDLLADNTAIKEALGWGTENSCNDFIQQHALGAK